MDVYIYGCNCGSTRVYVNKVKKYAAERDLDFALYNSKYDEEARLRHSSYLTEAGFESDQYEPILVSDKVERLNEWNL